MHVITNRDVYWVILGRGELLLQVLWKIGLSLVGAVAVGGMSHSPAPSTHVSVHTASLGPNSLSGAHDPHLPPIVAHMNGQPIYAKPVAQIAVELAHEPHAPTPAKAREWAATNDVINMMLLNAAGKKAGLDPTTSQAKKFLQAQFAHPSSALQQSLTAFGMTNKISGHLIHAYQLTFGRTRYEQKMLAQLPPNLQQQALQNIIHHLRSQAAITFEISP